MTLNTAILSIGVFARAGNEQLQEQSMATGTVKWFNLTQTSYAGHSPKAELATI